MNSRQARAITEYFAALDTWHIVGRPVEGPVWERMEAVVAELLDAAKAGAGPSRNPGMRS
ncbi:hypothetical protein D5S18_02885 [Nocardia panacis]|uniref:Uncharacterized protein n=1 Tax=Nocardia panacis TaxID=2340916 RepID=A0A3A4KPA9_9NOCA|nr:hypothetical protein D5S18_02885 [Nocardia panacis]